VIEIPLREIDINLTNPRKSIDERELEELTESIRQHGLLQPILVRPLAPEERQRRKRKYQIVIGSRRFHAAERAALTTIPCFVRGLSPDEAVVASFLDHVHHRTLTPAEEGEFLRYLREQRKLRLREIAALINKSIAYVHRRLGVFENPELGSAIREGRLSQAAAQEILFAPEPSWPVLIKHAGSMTTPQVRALVRDIAGSKMTPEDVERLLATRATAEPRPGQTASGYDPALRQHGPVTQVSASPAFVLLRLVREWQSGLPDDWTPTQGDQEILKQVLDLLSAAAERSTQMGSKAG
jgi:ParB/RepB/Spo0J family partition protein